VAARCIECREIFNRAAAVDKLRCMKCQRAPSAKERKSERATHGTLKDQLQKFKRDGNG